MESDTETNAAERVGLPWALWVKCALVGLVGGIVVGALTGVVL